jgi:hypothetical protein
MEPSRYLKRKAAERTRRRILIAQAALSRAKKLGAVTDLTRQQRREIEQFYVDCPDGWDVDHKVAFASGGKHELSNLQHLPAPVNQWKGDREVCPEKLAKRIQVFIDRQPKRVGRPPKHLQT